MGFPFQPFFLLSSQTGSRRQQTPRASVGHPWRLDTGGSLLCQRIVKSWRLFPWKRNHHSPFGASSHVMRTIASSLLFFCGVFAFVRSDDAPVTSTTRSSFSLEEIMLLADAAEMAQKKSSGDENGNADSSTLQHRLKQLIQTARVAAGSGQSTGNDVLDQTIRQIRARVNAGGGAESVSDTSIFDAALKAFGSNGAQSAPALIVDTVVKQLNPQAVQTTPAPQSDSFLGGILKQLANGNQEGGSDPRSALIDAVVKQFVPTTTTTTTTTTTARPSPLQLLDGLLDAYRGRQAADGGSKQPGQPNLLNGLQDLIKQLQTRPQQPPPSPGAVLPGTDTDAKSSQGQSGGNSQLLDGFLNQLKQLQSRGQENLNSTGSFQVPDFGDALKQIQNALRNRLGTATEQGGLSTVAPGSISLEGFEGLVPANGQPGVTAGPAAPAKTPQSPPTNTRDTLGKLFGGFVDQLRDNTAKGGNTDAANIFKGLGDIFNRNRQPATQ